MKLTKSQLKQIIKEEISNLDEGLWGEPTLSDWGWKVESDLTEIETTLEAKANEIESESPGAAKVYMKLGNLLNFLSNIPEWELKSTETRADVQVAWVEKATSEWRNLPNPEIQYREAPAGEEEYEEETL